MVTYPLQRELPAATPLLVNHAYRNVWCSPGVDRQYIIEPTRLTTFRGATYTTRIDNIRYNLPYPNINEKPSKFKPVPKYDVFMLGDILPQSVGLMKRPETWISAQVHSEEKKALIHVYNNEGRMYPLNKVFFVHTREGNLVVAIERVKGLPKFKEERLFIRFRSPVFFRKDTGEYTGVKNQQLIYDRNNSDYLTFRKHYNDLKDSGKGHVFCFVNGTRVTDFFHPELTKGDMLEYVWDGNVKEVTELRLKDLKTFQSRLDNTRKYFINREGLGKEIDFIDDTDFYIKRYKPNGRYEAIYYHQNQKDAIRMMTHRDYSIKSSYVHAILDHENWSIDDEVYVEVIVRHSGYNRDLIDEHTRIKELFKLPTEEIRLNAIFGSDSGVEVWKPENLEESLYLKLMSMKYGSIEIPHVIDVYGYNAISKLVGNVPLPVPNNRIVLDLGYNNYFDSVVYEYASDGTMIGWDNHDRGKNYVVRNNRAYFIEVYNGVTSESTKTIYNSHRNPLLSFLKDDRDYRFYVTVRPDESIHGKYIDVTGDDTYYHIEGNRVYWTNKVDYHATAIRNDLDFVTRNIEIPSDEGMLVFTVASLEQVDNTSDSYVVMDIPPGEIDIFLNGHELIEQVDYYIDWPEISIHSLKYRKDFHTQYITYRTRGFCTRDMKLSVDAEVGFVIHNQLSRNNRYNVRDDKITRVVIDGKLKQAHEVDFAEDGTFVQNHKNGTPFKVTHPYMSLLGTGVKDTYELREESLVIDREVAGYMDEYNKEEVIDYANIIDKKYDVISPFISRIIQDIENKFIKMDEFEKYKDGMVHEEIRERFQGYTYLLKYDPILNEANSDIFNIRPHVYNNVEMTRLTFNLLTAIIDIYLGGKLNLSRYVTIKED